MIEPRIDLKLRASEQQLYSLIKEIKRLRDTKQFASPVGTKTFLDIIENSCKSVNEFILRLKSQSVSQDIRKSNPERAIQRHCLLINYLNQFLSILDGSDIESVLPQVV